MNEWLKQTKKKSWGWGRQRLAFSYGFQRHTIHPTSGELVTLFVWIPSLLTLPPGPTLKPLPKETERPGGRCVATEYMGAAASVCSRCQTGPGQARVSRVVYMGFCVSVCARYLALAWFGRLNESLNRHPRSTSLFLARAARGLYWTVSVPQDPVCWVAAELLGDLHRNGGDGVNKSTRKRRKRNYIVTGKVW